METLQKYWDVALAVLAFLAVAIPAFIAGWHRVFGTDAPLWLSRLADTVVKLANFFAQRDAKTAAVVAAGATAELDKLVDKFPAEKRETAKLLLIQGTAVLEADLKKVLKT